MKKIIYLLGVFSYIWIIYIYIWKYEKIIHSKGVFIYIWIMWSGTLPTIITECNEFLNFFVSFFIWK